MRRKKNRRKKTEKTGARLQPLSHGQAEADEEEGVLEVGVDLPDFGIKSYFIFLFSEVRLGERKKEGVLEVGVDLPDFENILFFCLAR